MPIVAIVNSNKYAVHTDHLNTPRRLTQPDGTVAWQWAYSAFGDEQPTTGARRFTSEKTVPTSGTTSIAEVTFNLRYPGQYADAESGLSYNYFRSYMPATGRYTQPDPIGLDGGWNRFGYAGGNAISSSDFFGLWATNAHDYFIDRMFPHLPSAARDIIKEGSADADKPEFQGAGYAYMHAMSSNSMSPDEAKKLMCEYIKDQFSLANNSKIAGSSRYWFHLGMALHAVMDSTSPSHEGFQMWGGVAKDGHKHGPWPSSMENLNVAKTAHHTFRTMERMRKAMSGNLGECGC